MRTILLFTSQTNMKSLLTVFLIFLSSALIAQFTITYEDHYPSIGDQTYFTTYINPVLPVGITNSGPDQVWDFSAMDGGDQLSFLYAEPSEGIYADDYPSADWVEIGQGYANGGYTSAERYHSLGPEGVSTVGEFIFGFGKVDYSIPRLVFPSPMDYGDVVSDNYQATGNNLETGDIDERVGESDFEVDGYGTLILPHITYNDVVRLRNFGEQELDLGGGIQVIFRDTIYLWYSQEENYFVANYSKGEYVDLPAPVIESISYIRNPDEIIYFPKLAIEASADSACAGDCFTFTNLTDDSLFANEPDVTWNWSFPGAIPETSGAENPTDICYPAPGTYDVTIELQYDTLSFSQTFSNFITVLDSCGPVANFEYTPIVCLGQCYDFVNTSSNATDFFWNFEGAANPISEEFSPTEICFLEDTGIFNVTLTVANENGSSTSITQQITVVNPSPVNAGPDQTIIQGTTTVLSGAGGNGTGDYIWQPFENVTCFSCPATATYPLQETTDFVLYYEQSGGCQSSDTLTVFVEESFSFGVPGSFSPNGDGNNDVLYVRGSNITRMNFVVFNRYGEEVFSSNSQKVGWDGTKNGRELNAAVFGYFLEVFQSDGSRNELKGDVSLVR